jgi:hypothetical protein
MLKNQLLFLLRMLKPLILGENGVNAKKVAILSRMIDDELSDITLDTGLELPPSEQLCLFLNSFMVTLSLY